MRITALLGCLSLASVVTLASGQAATRRKWRFPKSGLYPVPDVGLSGVTGQVAAFGDFNYDKNTDLFILSSSQREIDVYTWDSKEGGFNKADGAHLDLTQRSLDSDPSIQATSLIPGDFNYDGQLDLLVIGQVDPQDDANGPLYMKIYLGNGQGGFEPNPSILSPASSAHPVLFDSNGDMTTDLLGFVQSDGKDIVKLWKNHAKDYGSAPLFTLEDITLWSDQNESLCKFNHPHSNAWLDLNGDCQADLFVTCQGASATDIIYQIWTNSNEKGLVFARSGSLPAHAGPVSFADMDGDGAVDMVFPTCDPGDKSGACQIHIVYNQQTPPCGPNQATSCHRVTDLCIADPQFKFDTEASESNDHHVIIQLHDLLSEETLVLQDPDFRGANSLRIQLGDFNYDGFADAMLTTRKNDGGTDQTAIRLLYSIQCSGNLCSTGATTTRRRTLALMVDGVSDLAMEKGLRTGLFFDLDDDGTLDIIQLQSPQDHSGTWHSQFMFNNFFKDAFFAKTLMLNGVCLKWCPGGHPDSPRAPPYGVNYPGATIKYTIVDNVGTKRVTQLAQLPQSNYMARLTPYNLFGLGRTNNYVEELVVGSNYNQSRSHRMWSGVIPNSQLVISPWQGSSKDAESWSIELYINISSSALGVLVVLLVTIFVLAATVLVLNWFEKREDKREKDRTLHVINFDAL
ncbi:hypothetical protein H4R33_001672 [Dimargaris cristalligena]|nr:hypothetical protein H4R33_001672 [Dimargaris cristalligena]